MKTVKWLGLIAGVLLSSYGWAHTDEFLDKQPAPHGGQVRMTESYHLELVIKDQQFTVYVMNHANEAQSSAGMQATATVLSGDTTTEIKLAPTTDNILQGTGEFRSSDDMKVAVSVTPAPQIARFTPLSKSAP